MKLGKHLFVLWTIALIVVIVVMAIIPFVRTVAWWIGAGCTIGMFALFALVLFRAFGKNGLISKLLGWPIFKVGFIALTVQLAVGAAIMGIEKICPVWVAVIAEVFVFAATGFCLTVKDAAREAVTASTSETEDNTSAWKVIRTRASAIAKESGHPELVKLSEAVRYSDPMPTSMDGDFARMLETLSSYADAANIKKAFTLLEQRNALAKESKRKV